MKSMHSWLNDFTSNVGDLAYRNTLMINPDQAQGSNTHVKGPD
jgi:hypothetical protein